VRESSRLALDAAAGPASLVDVVRAVVDRCGSQGWAVRPTGTWCDVTPPEAVFRPHGWKLLLSATSLSAPTVLARAAEVLAREGCSFTFGTDIDRVTRHRDIWYDQGSAGEFLAAYPRDDQQCRDLAAQLHQVTEGLPGPRILAARQLRPGSLLHYRFGTFTRETVFTDDGMFESLMTGPDGSTFQDRPGAGFSPPPWAAPLFPESPPEAPAPTHPKLLGGRFLARKVLRHTSRGSGYLAEDRHSGAEVVVERARAHTDVRPDGTDARDRLREQARLLDLLAPSGIAPRRLAQFDEWGDLFVAEERIPGQPLLAWVAQRADDGAALDASAARAVALQLVSLLETVHRAGLVVRDLSPVHVLVTPSQEVRLVDVKHMAELGREQAATTPSGFTAPEAAVAGDATTEVCSLPEPSADCYSLGVTLFCMLTSLPPHWVSGRHHVRRRDPDLRRTLAQIARSRPVLTPFIDAIVGLTATDPAERWSLADCGHFLRAVTVTGTPAPASAGEPSRPRPEDLDELLANSVAYLRRSITPHESVLWPRSPLVDDHADPCAAWWGAAGPLAALTRVAPLLDDTSLWSTVETAAAWIDERLFAVPRLLPGLCMGRSGTAWALHDAGRLLGDDTLVARAVELAHQLPREWPIPDVTHGLSGTGLAYLHLWQATADPALLERALNCAETVLAATYRDGDAWTWPTPRDIDSHVAGANRYGFAHGVAGVGTFLLAAARAAAQQDQHAAAERFMGAALGAGRTLADAVLVREDGAAWWPVEILGKPIALGSWCNGSVGIGTFLIRLWAATGEQRFLELAEGAAATAFSRRWLVNGGACCGISGQGHLLLDLAELSGKETYRARAHHLAGLLHAQRSEQHGIEVPWPSPIGGGYAQGAAGVLDFLTRLRYGGPRPWLPPCVEEF
jgi:serine/threonine protein kinase